jgi:Fe-S-cluster containining protein
MNPADLEAAVLTTSWRPDAHAAVRQLYSDLDAEISRRRPLCVLSGRCCNFEEFGHRLFVTTIELATFLHDYLNQSHTPPSSSKSWDGKGCPFQIGKLCGVHSMRPMGCRLYFCDDSSTSWQREQYELFHSRLKRLHESMEVPYAYMEWRSALNLLGYK